ncbi:MAG: aldo/keto reductase [Actinomycetota bacterium]|nr:aldo/keto reductase [Actinomycetota bacterium]
MTRTEPHTTAHLASGAAIPLVGLGTWAMRGRECYDAVRYTLDVGYRLVDTATMYGNEREVGRAVRDSGVPRDEVWVTTKLPPERAGRERATIEASLEAMGLDHVDLWLVHWPPDGDASPRVWERFLEIRADGLASEVGVSNYDPAQVDALVEATGVAPAVNQIPWSPRDYDADRLRHSRDRGVVLEGYSPFKRSDLDDAVLTDVAATHGMSPAQVVLRWHVEHGVVVIPKSAEPERIAANLAVFDFALNEDEVRRIDALSRVD